MISVLKESCSQQRHKTWAGESVEILKKYIDNYDSLSKDDCVGNDFMSKYTLDMKLMADGERKFQSPTNLLLMISSLLYKELAQ